MARMVLSAYVSRVGRTRDGRGVPRPWWRRAVAAVALAVSGSLAGVGAPTGATADTPQPTIYIDAAHTIQGSNNPVGGGDTWVDTVGYTPGTSVTVTRAVYLCNGLNYNWFVMAIVYWGNTTLDYADVPTVSAVTSGPQLTFTVPKASDFVRENPSYPPTDDQITLPTQVYVVAQCTGAAPGSTAQFSGGGWTLRFADNDPGSSGPPPPPPTRHLSGTVRATDCSDAACSRVAAPDVPIKVVGTATDGNPVSASASSKADGSWAADVAAGTYTVTPPDGYVPASAPVDATAADVPGIDFATCVSGAAPAARAHTASGQSGCPDGLDWQMIARTTDVPGIAAKAPNGMLRNQDIYAPYTADLNLTLEGAKVEKCAAGSSWTWEVTTKPAAAKVLTAPPNGCNTFMQVDTQGTYHVVAREIPSGSTSPKLTVEGDVNVKDVLVVAMGDSNGSGEGDPPFWFNRCNRGSASYQYQAAQLLEKQSDGHASVTFVSASCSGARTEHLYGKKYEGIRPGSLLDPQLTQLTDQLAPPSGTKPRKPDAALVSIGVNDIAFGPILAYCIPYDLAKLATNDPGLVPACQDSFVAAHKDAVTGGISFTHSSKSHKTLTQAINGLVRQLPAHYDKVAAGIAHSGLVPANMVYVSQYPAFWFKGAGTYCGTTILEHSTWKWLADEGEKLNGQVARAAGAHSWNLVPVDRGLFYGHGYCAAASWFVGLLKAATYNRNKEGAFHPTKRGAHVTAVSALMKLCPLLADKKACVSFPTP